MKILQVNAVNRTSSTGRICYDLCEFLNGMGHECVVAHSKPTQPVSDNEFIIGNNRDRKIHAFLSRLSGKQGYFSKGATNNLLKYMDEFKPDMVFIHNIHANYLNFPMLFKYIADNNIAMIVFLHDCWAYTGKCCYYTETGCNKWLNGCGDCPRLHNDNKSWFLDRTNKVWNHKKALYENIKKFGVIGVSDWIAEEAKKAPLFRKNAQITRIYNWIDFEKFNYDQSKTEEIRKEYDLLDKKVLLCVAPEWIKRKGVDDIYKLSNMLADDEKLVCIGKLQEGFTMPEGVIHVPHTDSVDVLRAWYNTADVFVNLSREETFGLVASEAISCGTPVVCYNTTANPELVGEVCGCVCKTNSVEDFYKCISLVLANGKDYYRDNCVSFAKENFNKQENLKKILQFIEKIEN